MFKCKKLENSVMIQEYLEELNKNDFTHLMKLINIASNEKRFILMLQNHKFSHIDYENFSIFQNICESKNFIELCKIECKRLLYRNYENPNIINIERIIHDYELYSENEFFSICEHILSMNEYDQYMSSYYEYSDLEYEVNYEEDITTLTALTYPYQLFL